MEIAKQYLDKAGYSIYNDGINFAKLQRVLISNDDNLNFLINFIFIPIKFY